MSRMISLSRLVSCMGATVDVRLKRGRRIDIRPEYRKANRSQSRQDLRLAAILPGLVRPLTTKAGAPIFLTLLRIDKPRRVSKVVTVPVLQACACVAS